MNAPDTRKRYRGFTLVELLMVIVIIALLAALLLPAIGGAVRNARNAQVTAEINQMAQALADFKNKYGDYPPSRIILNESGDYSNTTLSTFTFTSPHATDQSNQALIQRSITFLRKFWPRFQINTVNGTGAIYSGTTAGAFPDFNGNGTLDTTAYILSGDECLVWFLGGLAQGQGSPTGFVQNWAVTGFGRNPINPFQSSLVSSANRVQPFFEFKTSRLVDLDGDGFPSYLDPLGVSRPYAYFSSYAGTGYDPNDVNFDPQTTVPSNFVINQLTEQDDAASVPVTTLNFHVMFPTTQTSNNLFFATSPSPNPYTTTTTNPVTQTPSVLNPPTFLNPQTFQIISAGGDAFYGVGGQYTPNAGSPLPFDATNTTPAADTALRTREDDNLTNFTTSRLN